jgi:hypothetical protein
LDEYEIGQDTVIDVLNGKPGKKYQIGKITAGQFW